MNTKRAVLSLAVACLLLAGCQLAVDKTRRAVFETAAAIDLDLKNIKVAEETAVDGIDDVYAHLDRYDLSTDKMDVQNGGIYDTFQGGKYYFKTVQKGTALYVSPGRPVDNGIRREVRIMGYMDPFLQKAYTSSNVISAVFYGFDEPLTVALLYPWFDVVSTFPPGIHLSTFEWYNRGLKSAGRPIWSKEPFTDLATGWVMDVADSTIREGKVKGVVVISVALRKVVAKYLKGQNLQLVLLGPDTTIVGLTSSAKAILKLKVLEDFDYVTQMRKNSFVASDFKLSGSSQPPSVRALAVRVQQGNSAFEQVFEGRTYEYFQARVPENGLTVLGFAAR